ncbi:MAG TPA: transglutaminase family protein [Usitatibacter sp.]|nr:transglutaminase family protein [Usitatibacter sp.]
MIQLTFAIELRYEIAEQPADFVFNIHAARTPWQTVVRESVLLTPQVPFELQEDPTLGNRYMRVTAGPGAFTVRYDAVVEIDHHRSSPALLDEAPIARIPPQVLPYLYPSRYCQSDRLRRYAGREFGNLKPGFWRVQAIQDWVRTRTQFVPGTSNISTSAVDTLQEQVGVCRDFAHLMIAMCRAVNIPARFTTGIDYGAAAELGLPDFHAYVEVYLGDRWYSFDPTGITAPMGLLRIGTGRDAADVSFATMFGSMKSFPPKISITALDDPANGYHLPTHSLQALSTSAGAMFEANPHALRLMAIPTQSEEQRRQA